MMKFKWVQPPLGRQMQVQLVKSAILTNSLLPVCYKRWEMDIVTMEG